MNKRISLYNVHITCATNTLVEILIYIFIHLDFEYNQTILWGIWLSVIVNLSALKTTTANNIYFCRDTISKKKNTKIKDHLFYSTKLSAIRGPYPTQ